MKKIGVSIALFLIFFLLYFLQANLFNWFTIADVMPNLFVLLLLFIGLFAGKTIGIAYGIVFGIMLDFIIGNSVFIYALLLAFIGFLGGYFDKNFSKDSRITIMFMIAGSTAIFEIGYTLLQVLLFSASINVFEWIRLLAIEVFYQLLLSIIVYPLFQNFGYYVEELFKENHRLTRYF